MEEIFSVFASKIYENIVEEDEISVDKAPWNFNSPTIVIAAEFVKRKVGGDAWKERIFDSIIAAIPRADVKVKVTAKAHIRLVEELVWDFRKGYLSDLALKHNHYIRITLVEN